jgi:hypothetical protein
MRSVRSLVWSSVFVMGAAVPAFCQIIVPPNVPGAAVPANIGTTSFEQNVFSTGPFDASLAVLRNGQLKYFVSSIICTSGPFTTVKFDVPLGTFGLVAGDSLIFAFVVHHRTTEGNTTSLTLSVIPVIAAPVVCPPTTTSRAPDAGATDGGRWARREDTSCA